jgi:predicted amidohydrolase
MFNTGFSISPGKVAEPMDGPSVRFLAEKAREMNAAIMATLLVAEGGSYLNRLVCMHPDGSFQAYDKRHLFRLSEEYRLISGGVSKTLVTVKGWRISPQICYDLRFPVWSKNTWKEGAYEYDVLVYLANWPGSRAHVWKTLLMARAIENQSYAIGVNRVGEDGHGTWHAGDSLVSDAKGQLLYEAEKGRESIATVTLSAQELALFRESFTIGPDWDRFIIQ